MALDREIIRKKFLKNLFLLKNINFYFEKDQMIVRKKDKRSCDTLATPSLTECHTYLNDPFYNSNYLHTWNHSASATSRVRINK